MRLSELMNCIQCDRVYIVVRLASRTVVSLSCPYTLALTQRNQHFPSFFFCMFSSLLFSCWLHFHQETAGKAARYRRKIETIDMCRSMCVCANGSITHDSNSRRRGEKTLCFIHFNHRSLNNRRTTIGKNVNCHHGTCVSYVNLHLTCKCLKQFYFKQINYFQ